MKSFRPNPHIEKTEVGGKGTTFRIIFTETDLEHAHCGICVKKLKEFEEVYCCEQCKTTFHTTCVQNHRKKHAPMCEHLVEQCQYFCGQVFKEQK